MKKRKGILVDLEAAGQEKTAVEDPTEAIVVRALVQEALNSLKEEQRTVVELRIIKGYSVAETAKIMNKKEGTIRVLQYRALEALAAILGNENPMRRYE